MKVSRDFDVEERVEICHTRAKLASASASASASGPDLSGDSGRHFLGGIAMFNAIYDDAVAQQLQLCIYMYVSQVLRTTLL